MPRTSNLRERILKIAGEQFLSQGFYKVSIDSLVAGLRTSKSSIYKYFESKEALVGTLVEQLNTIINRQLAQIVDTPESGFEEKLLQITRFTSKLMRLVSKQFLEDLRIHTPELWDAYQQQRTERVHTYYHRLFQQGVDEGVIRRDISLQLIVLAYLQLTELTVNQERLSNLPYGNEEIYEHLTTLFLEGVVGR